MPKTITKTIFVCSPLRGHGEQTAEAIEKNIDLAKRLCLAVIKQGHAPFAPHIFFPLLGLDDKNEVHRAAGIAAGLAWLGQAAEMWIFAHDTEQCSDGMRLEIAKAEKFSIPPKLVFMPKCWAEFESELPPPLPKLVRQENPLRGNSRIPGDRV